MDPDARPSVFRPGILEGRVALVTGGGSGIGYTIAEELGRAGAHVAIAGRNEERLEAARAGLLRSGVREVLAHPCDVRDADTVERLFKRIGDSFGRLDILVNNAAGNFLCRARDLSPNGFRSVVEIDLVGTFLCSRAAYPLLAESRGTIVNISATLAELGLPLQAHAGSAKAGVDALTRHLASEWGPDGIRVVAVAPGPIADTEGMRRLGGGREEAIARATPLRRLGRRREVARLVVFLASDDAAWITGTTVIIDGGHRLRSGFAET